MAMNQKNSTEQIQQLTARLDGCSTEEILRTVTDMYGNRVALASSFGAEDQALTHMLWAVYPAIRVFTLDTGRLNQETYDVMQKTRDTYGISVEITFPDSDAVTQMVTEHGPNLFYTSVENRKTCCAIRKVAPLQKKLAGFDVWITGLRRSQSVTRSDIQLVEYDQAHNMIKLNPLLEWSNDQVWEYIRTHNVPYNALHDKGYPSIGCACCTRAVEPGEDIRAGRWWWENPETKECGLHIKDGKLVRKKG